MLVDVCDVTGVIEKHDLYVDRAPHNDYSPDVLQSINDSLYLNIFDEYLCDISQVMFSGVCKSHICFIEITAFCFCLIFGSVYKFAYLLADVSRK